MNKRKLIYSAIIGGIVSGGIAALLAPNGKELRSAFVMSVTFLILTLVINGFFSKSKQKD